MDHKNALEKLKYEFSQKSLKKIWTKGDKGGDCNFSTTSPNFYII